MAFSSYFKANIVKRCEVCKTETNFNRGCIQCCKCLCDKCEQIHNKKQTNIHHHIVDLKTPLQDVEQKVVLDNIICDEHHTKMACLFCRTCDHPVCQVCVSRTHNKHKFESIENIFSEKMDELKKVKEFQVSEAKCESVFDETITQIKQKEETMIGAISKYSIEVQNEDEIEQKTVKKTFSNIKRQIDQAEDNYTPSRGNHDSIGIYRSRYYINNSFKI